MMETMKIVVALLALRLDDAGGFNSPANPPESPSSSSPLRVASTAWATTNDGVGAWRAETNPSRTGVVVRRRRRWCRDGSVNYKNQSIIFFFSNLEFSFPRIFFSPVLLRNNGDTHL
jgi:hypothetical protein